MAWIRLDDQIAHHPKVLKVGLSAWLYVGCIGFAQRFLTDGHVPDAAIPTLCGGVEKPLTHIKKLVSAGLLERVDGGYQIHDYLEFNESATVVRKKREEDRKRKHSERNPAGIQSDSEQNPAGVLARAPASHPIPSHPYPSKKKEEQASSTVLAATTITPPNGNGHDQPTVNARSHRPIFQGQRFVVFDWMLEDMGRILGRERLEAFDVSAWFFELDAQIVADNHVIPKTEQWNYIQAALLAEAAKRGLPIVSVPPPTKRKASISERLDAAGAEFIANERKKLK